MASQQKYLNNFETLWKMMWGIEHYDHNNGFNYEALSSQKKFELLKMVCQ